MGTRTTLRQIRPWILLVSLTMCLTGPAVAWRIRFPGRRPRQEQHQSSEEASPVDPTFSEGYERRIDPTLLVQAVQDASVTVEENHHHVDGFSPEELMSSISQRFLEILWYKPPVGIVALALTLRLIWTGRIFAWDQRKKQPTVDSLLARQQSLGRQGRALKLDKDDVNYRNFGGVERVRGRLLWAALGSLIPMEVLKSPVTNVAPAASSKAVLSSNETTAEQSSLYSFGQTVLRILSGGEEGLWTDNTTTSGPTPHPLLQTIVDALGVTAHPRKSRTQYSLELVPLLARMEHILEYTDVSLAVGIDTHNATMTTDQLYSLVALATTTMEVRAMDALLRICRDRLLKTTFRLARTTEHWQRRLQQRPMWMQRLFGSLKSDRTRLAYAQAAYQAEVQRLGQVIALLLRRPNEMKDESLVKALKQTHEERNRTKTAKSQSKWSFGPELTWRWTARGEWGVSFHKMEVSSISGTSATETLTQDDHTAWQAVARQWNQEARSTLCQVIRESLDGSSSTPAELSATEFAKAERQWCISHYDDDKVEHLETQWRTMVRYVDSLPLWRRVGEGQVVRLKDAAIVSWTRHLDVLGIPSSLLGVWGAHRLHKWILPYWPSLKKDFLELMTKTKEILVARAWVPLKGIYDDIMNKSPGMMSAFGLEVEEQSLDHMLRDLGFGDGTPESRHEALKGATEQYEHDLNSGLLVNFARGRLVRLLLVQIQQLKVGLLSALDTIDVLMRGNKIHFQVLAAIPAVVIATYGTRLFVRALYNIRAKDLRPVTVVHGEMAKYLSHMEHLILQPLTQERSAFTLGELVLTMHRYLILLDFSNPPFATTECDQIHQHLQSLLAEAAEGRRPLDRIDRIQQRHQDLLKSL